MAETTPYTTRGLRRIIVHEDYTRILNGTKRNIYADIALVELDKKVEVRPQSNVLTPICLPRPGNLCLRVNLGTYETWTYERTNCNSLDVNLNGFDAVMAGWGDKSLHGAVPNVLQKLRVTISNYPNCHLPKNSNRSFSQVDKLCAKSQEVGKGSCYVRTCHVVIYFLIIQEIVTKTILHQVVLAC